MQISLNETTAERANRHDRNLKKYGLDRGCFYDRPQNIKLPPYDETNQQYKKFERAELSAKDLIYDDKELPDNLANYLLSTITERQAWHRYCRTHQRNTRDFTKEEIEDIFS